MRMISATSSSKLKVIKSYRDNLVDYADEVECFYMLRYFDKDNDGYLDFDE